MVGVTLFGIFLTPVFFSVILGLSETRLFTAGGHALGRLDRWSAGWRARGSASCSRGSASASVACHWASAACGGTAGVLAALAVLGIHRDESGHRPLGSPPELIRPHPHLKTGATERRCISRDFALLHRPSGLRHRALARHRAGRARGRVHAAGGAVSRGDAPHRAGDGLLPGGQRPDGAQHRRRADRGAGQRRREHAVHVVAVHQRRRLQPDRDLPAGHGHRHGPGAGAEPRVAGAAGHPGPGAERGHQRQEDVAQHADDRQPDLARRPVRQHVPEQLRDDLHQGRAGPAAGRRRHHLPGPARLQPAGLARPRQAGGPEPERHRRGQRHQPAEPPGRRRADRPAARPAGPAIPAHDQHPGPAGRARAVRRHHPQGRRSDTFQATTAVRRHGGSTAAGRAHGQGGQSGASFQGGATDQGRLEQPGRRACRRPPASSGSATWPGSSWARGSTTSPAPSTASRRWRSPSTSCPAPTRSRPPSGVYAKMRELKSRFPDGLDYKIVYDTTPFIQRVGQRGLQDPPRRRHPGRHRRAGLPAGLEGHDPADDRRAGLA